MLLMSSQHPQRRRQSGPRSAAPAVGAQRRALTDDGAQGTPPPMPRCCVFSKFTRSNRRVYAEQLPKSVFPLSCLIPQTFTHSNL
jgi:hypothetical protein